MSTLYTHISACVEQQLQNLLVAICCCLNWAAIVSALRIYISTFVKHQHTLPNRLLDKGTEVNALGGPFGSPIQAASYEGHENIVQLLLNKGGKYGSVIQAAAFENIVQLLLHKGTDVKAQTGLLAMQFKQ
ncbi:hypothetical protein B0H19DRAFT_1084170 [Mycena capillaripes]|nr:hypothetical protein B0H19DRAFT_1084170 [Mycena capillaripes]